MSRTASFPASCLIIGQGMEVLARRQTSQIPKASACWPRPRLPWLASWADRRLGNTLPSWCDARNTR